MRRSLAVLFAVVLATPLALPARADPPPKAAGGLETAKPPPVVPGPSAPVLPPAPAASPAPAPPVSPAPAVPPAAAAVPVPRHVGVLDRDGVPFVGAEIVEVPVDRDDVAVIADDATVLGVTNADGAFVPPALVSSAVRLAVRAPGGAAVLLPRSSGPVLVRLVAASPVRGWVREADGTAPVGALVEARRVGGGETAFRAGVDASGRFALETLPEGAWRLRLRRRDGAWQSLGVAVGPAEVAPAVLVRGALVTATVRDLDAPRRPPSSPPPAPVAAPAVPAPAHAPAPARPAAPPCLGLSIRLVRLGAPPAGDEVAVEGVCADDGTIQFGDLLPGVYEAALVDPARIWDGPAPRVEVDAPRATPAGTWFVRHRGAIAGHVVDADRKPIAGATVRASPPAGETPPPGGFGGAEPVKSGADGGFLVEGLAPSEGWRVVASIEGRSPAVEAPVSVSFARTHDVGRVRLEASWRLRVSVRDAEGRPLDGVALTASPADRPGLDPSDPVTRALARRASTDPAGTAVLVDLPDGTTRVRASRRGFVDADVEAQGPAGRREAAIEVVLAPAARLRGRLTAGTGAPPKGAVLVRGRVLATGRDLAVEPDADGRFVLEDLPPGPVDVEAVRRGGSPDLVLARIEGALPGGRDELVLPLSPAWTVSGRVTGVGITGDARVRVRLEVLRPDADRSRDVRVVAAEVATTSDRGERRFSFESVPPGPYALRAIQGRLDGGAVPIQVDAADVGEVELPLPAGAVVAGRVRDARSGRTGLGAVVRLVRVEGGALAPVSVADRPATVAAADGTFEFEGVAPGLWRVEATDPGAAPASAAARAVEGERVVVPTLVLTRGGSVEGRLLDVRGRPLSGVPVRAWRRPQLEEAPGAVSTEDGAFRLAPLEAGRYRVRVEDRAGAAASVEAEVEVVDGEATKVDLSPSGRALLVGTLRRHGAPVGGAGVELASDDACGCDRILRRATSDPYGRFVFDGLPAGTYVLRALDGQVLGAGPIRLRGAERADRDVELGEARLEGVVRTVGGVPVRGAEVVALPRSAEEDAVGRVRTGPDGTFSIPGLGVGTYRVEVTPRGRPTRVVEGVLADLPGAGRPLEVVIGGGGTLDLTVRDEGRRGVGGAEVWVENPAGEALHPRAYFTSPSGRLTVDGLPDGPVRVRVRARGLGRPRPVATVVREGAVAYVEATLPGAGALRLLVTAGRDPVARARVDVLRMPEGEPVESRRTLRRGDDRNNAFGVTARTGTLVVEDLADGEYVAVVTAGSELETARVPVRIRRGEVTDVGVALLPRAR